MILNRVIIFRIIFLVSIGRRFDFFMGGYLALFSYFGYVVFLVITFLVEEWRAFCSNLFVIRILVIGYF